MHACMARGYALYVGTFYLHVGRLIDDLGQLGHLHGEALLHLLQHLLVLGARDEGDRKTLGAEPARTAHAVKVLVS